MVKEQAGNSVELEHQCCEIIREVYESIHTSGLDKFTFSLIDSLWNDLNIVIPQLERLPEGAFKELLEVIEGLAEARNELRLARFLFDVEEINAIYRLMMRNRAVLRGEQILHKVLTLWPSQSAS
jgi:hypothetical protein